MSQGKSDVVKQEMARVNINILGVNELKCEGIGELNSDDHDIYCCGQESLKRNGIAFKFNKSPKCSTVCNFKNDRMIFVCFQSKQFVITVTQVCAPAINAEEAEV